MPGTIRVGIVDDHPSILAAISAAIDAEPDLALSGTGRTLDDAVDLLARSDVLLCDVQLEGSDGLRVLDIARQADPAAAVLLISGHGHHSIIRAAVERGAAGYLDKSVEVDTIVAAVRTVAAGGTAYSAADLAHVRSAPRGPSDRERQVIAAVVAGRTNAEIAAGLGLSDKTVETHLHRLFDRYAVLSRTELAVLAIDEGWVRDDGGVRG
jgi:DNA-binding NarL/FixJ family response regulator